MPKRRAASRWLSPSTWQAWRTRAYSSTAFILPLPAVRTGRKIRRRLFTPPPRPDAPAASVRDFLSAAYIDTVRYSAQEHDPSPAKLRRAGGALAGTRAPSPAAFDALLIADGGQKLRTAI